jgi:DNA-binding MarR family transcriptional regulator
MPHTSPTLGSLLRHLVELLDNDVERTYRNAGLDYRPRFTPVMRALSESGPCSIREIAVYAGISHSAASQTVAEMLERTFVLIRPGADARERIVHLTSRGRALLPSLRGFWDATNAAADELVRELGVPLPELLIQAIHALEQRPFGDRIAAKRASRAPRASRRPPISRMRDGRRRPAERPS